MERLRISFYGSSYPFVIPAYAGVQNWYRFWHTREISGGHQALKGAVAHQWIPWVTLEGRGQISCGLRATSPGSQTPWSYQVFVPPDPSLPAWPIGRDSLSLWTNGGTGINATMKRRNQLFWRHWLKPWPMGPITGRGLLRKSDPHSFFFLNNSLSSHWEKVHCLQRILPYPEIVLEIKVRTNTLIYRVLQNIKVQTRFEYIQFQTTRGAP